MLGTFLRIEIAAWIDCSLDRAGDVDVCRAWDPVGHLIAHGRHRLDGQNRAATPSELHPSNVQRNLSRSELSWIDLYGGKTLVPVNDASEPLERFEVH